MFRFEHPAYLYALILLPVLAALFLAYLQWRKRAIGRFGDRSLIDQLMPGASKYKHPVKFSLLLLSLAFVIVGLANPQWGSKREKVQRKSVDVFIALDISNSMYAEDVAPNRLERAKKFAENLVEKLKGERIGLILFAGGAYLQAPLTTDYTVIQLFLRSASPELAGTQGTLIGSAIDAARLYFPEENTSHKALILITDAEDEDPDALLEAQKESDHQGIIIFTVGVGTPEGSFIPMVINGREDYKRDETGQPVRSKLNEDALKELAQIGGGAYFPISRGGDVATALQERIDKMEKREFEMRSFTSFDSYFQYFLAGGLLLLMLEFLISYRKEKWLEGKDIFN
jgi:Ca-activated chloride channel homolog